MSDLISEKDPQKAAEQLAAHLNTSEKRGDLKAGAWCNHGKYRVYINGLSDKVKAFYDLKEEHVKRLQEEETQIGENWDLVVFAEGDGWQQAKASTQEQVAQAFADRLGHLPEQPPKDQAKKPEGDQASDPMDQPDGDSGPPF